MEFRLELPAVAHAVNRTVEELSGAGSLTFLKKPSPMARTPYASACWAIYRGACEHFMNW